MILGLLSFGFFWILFGIGVGILAGSWGRSAFLWFIIALVASPLLSALLLLALGKQEGEGQGKQSGGSAGGFDPKQHHKQCPDCAERIKLQARVCRYCGNEFSEDVVKEQVREKIEEEVPEAPPWEEADGRCPECRTPMRDGTETCPGCGRKVDWSGVREQK